MKRKPGKKQRDHGGHYRRAAFTLARDIRRVRKYFPKGEPIALLELEMLIASAKHLGWIAGFREGCQ